MAFEVQNVEVASKNVSVVVSLKQLLRALVSDFSCWCSYCCNVLLNPRVPGTLVSACGNSSSLSKNQLYWISLPSCNYCVPSHLR